MYSFKIFYTLKPSTRIKINFKILKQCIGANSWFYNFYVSSRGLTYCLQCEVTFAPPCIFHDTVCPLRDVRLLTFSYDRRWDVTFKDISSQYSTGHGLLL